jgi:hypothetical protein
MGVGARAAAPTSTSLATLGVGLTRRSRCAGRGTAFDAAHPSRTDASTCATTLMPGEGIRDFDNPFSRHILDAIGMAARAIYPNPRIWRAFMERVVADLSPAANKVYITLNRFLADHGVLPEIKAALRARSELRPADDKDLIPTFSKMLHDAVSGLPTDVAVPNLEGTPADASVFDFAAAGERAEAAVAALLPSAVTATRMALRRHVEAH